MLFEQLYAQGQVLGTALQGTLLRNQVISNNIANSDVPNFKASRVDFEQQMIDALGDFPRNRRVDLSGVEPTIRTDRADLMQRIDNNNVDIEIEMVRLYENSMRFDTMVSSIIANSRRLNTVLQRGQ